MKERTIGILICCFVIICSTVSAIKIRTDNAINDETQKHPWPMVGQNSQHTGQSPYDADEITYKLKGSGIFDETITGPPVINKDGIMYVTTFDFHGLVDEWGYLYAMHKNTSIIWKIKIDQSPPVFSVPAIGPDDTIYVITNDEYFYAFNPNGTIKWTFLIPEGYGHTSPTIGSDGTIYFGAEYISGGGYIYALNSDGTEKWCFTTLEGVEGSPAVGYDGTIYATTLDPGPDWKDVNGYLYAINPKDGSLKWEYFIVGSPSAPTIGSDGTIYIGSDKDYGYLYAIKSDGTEKWSIKISGKNCIGTVDFPRISSDGTIYICAEHIYKTHLYAVNPNGNIKWTFTTKSWPRSAPTLDSNGVIYYSAGDNYFYVLNKNGIVTLKIKITSDGEDSMIMSPIINADGRVYVCARPWFTWENSYSTIYEFAKKGEISKNINLDKTISQILRNGFKIVKNLIDYLG